jgi:hypothetical protein
MVDGGWYFFMVDGERWTVDGIFFTADDGRLIAVKLLSLGFYQA